MKASVPWFVSIEDRSGRSFTVVLMTKEATKNPSVVAQHYYRRETGNPIEHACRIRFTRL